MNMTEIGHLTPKINVYTANSVSDFSNDNLKSGDVLITTDGKEYIYVGESDKWIWVNTIKTQEDSIMQFIRLFNKDENMVDIFAKHSKHFVGLLFEEFRSLEDKDHPFKVMYNIETEMHGANINGTIYTIYGKEVNADNWIISI